MGDWGYNEHIIQPELKELTDSLIEFIQHSETPDQLDKRYTEACEEVDGYRFKVSSLFSLSDAKNRTEERLRYQMQREQTR